MEIKVLHKENIPDSILKSVIAHIAQILLDLLTNCHKNKEIDKKFKNFNINWK